MEFLISGMFRSGSTLLAKMLDANPSISVVVDPFMQFFKTIYNNVLNDYGINEMNIPLSAFHYPEPTCTFDVIRNSWGEIVVDEEVLEKIIKNIASYVGNFAPFIIPRLNELKTGKAKDVYQHLLKIAFEEYRKEGESAIGTKDCWVEKFAYNMSAQKEKLKFIFIIRDPRAIIASKNVLKNNKAPILFLIRQWRESVSHIRIIEEMLGPKRVAVIKYEDLVKNPGRELDRLSIFLHTSFNDSMLNTSKYRDGNNQKWQNNSSYHEKEMGISTQSIDRWKKVLKPKEVLFIEALAHKEMKLESYKLVNSDAIISALIPQGFPEVSYDSLSGWIKESTISRHIKDKAAMSMEMGKEWFRQWLLENDICKDWDNLMIQVWFYDSIYYNKLKKVGV